MNSEFENIIDEMATRWAAPVVARKAVWNFSGGILNPKTLANADSRGVGPEGKFILLNQAAYPTEALVAWLKARGASSWGARGKEE